VASPLQCFNMEVAKYREINARLLEEITENRSRLERTGEEHEAAKKMVKRVEFDINLVEREGKRLEEGLSKLRHLDQKAASAFGGVETKEKDGDSEQIEIDFDCLDEEEEVTLLSRDDDDADGGGAVSVKKGDNSGFEAESVVKRGGGGGGHVDVEGDDDDDDDDDDGDEMTRMTRCPPSHSTSSRR